MAKKNITAQPETPRKVNVNIHVPKESKMDVDFGGLKLKEPKSVTLHGSVTSLSQDEYGKSFGMDIDSIDLGAVKERKTTKEIVSDLKKKRTFKFGEEEADEEE